MTLDELVRRVCDKGEASVREAYAKPGDEHKLAGALDGFGWCRRYVSFEHYEAELEGCRKRNAKLRDGLEKSKLGAREYWRDRYRTLQIEHVFEVLRVAWGKYPHSAKAALLYESIVGVR